MSSLKGIQIVMSTFAQHFSKGKDWQGVMERSWAAVLLKDELKDKTLIDAMDNLCCKFFEYPNSVNLSNYLQEVEALVKENGGTGLTGNTYHYCDDCEYQSGIVKVVSVYVKGGEEYRKPTSTRCICEGATAKYPNMISWSELEEQGQLLHRTGQIELLYFYRTSRDMPTMPESIRNPEYHAKVLERLEQEKDEKLFNPYLWAVKGVAKAAGLTLDDNGNVIGEVHVPPEQPTVRPNVQPTPPPVQQPQQPQQPKQTTGMSDEDFWRDHF